jgi:TRAP-type C4-dicarboxylate transport system permease small subunit
MIASARAMHDRSHISVEILPIIFAKKERISKTVSLITLLLVNFFLAVMVVQTVRFCINSIGTNCTTVRIPILYVYLILPVGFSLMLWFEIKNLVEDAIFVFAGKLAGGKGA